MQVAMGLHSQAALTARQARAAQRTSGPEPCALSVRAVAPLGSCFAVFARPARTAAQRLSAAALLGQVRHCSGKFGVVVCATQRRVSGQCAQCAV